MKSFLPCLFYLFVICLLPFKTAAQSRMVRVSSDCRRVISLDLGAHRVSVNGPFGGHFGFNIENIVSNNFSFNFNAMDFVNAYSLFIPSNGYIEHRIVVQPSFSFYPVTALHGFYANLGCGAMLYFNNNPKWAIKNDGLVTLFPDVKLGFQSIEWENLAWNVYAGFGVFMPKTISNSVPIFEAGVKIGLKL